MLKHRITGILILGMSAGISFFTGRQFLNMHHPDVFFPSTGLTSKKLLSEYFPALKKTQGDTTVYLFQGREEGGNILILGGTHPNEPAGFITTVVLLENINVKRGKIFILPQANISGFTHNDPHEGNPQYFSLRTEGKSRRFRFGSRLTNPVHQWPDPTLFINAAGQKLSGAEVRNLNRSYPGKAHGHLTEKIAFGIMELIQKEKIDLAIDLHEAAPEYPVVNAMVFHENTAELAAIASMDLQVQGVDLRLEASPPGLRGLSHREWGDHSYTLAVLLETANVSHGRLKGKPSASLIVEGKDRNYLKASKLGLLFVPFDEQGIPLKERVFRHLSSVKALLAGLEDILPEKAVTITDFPDIDTVREQGPGLYLQSPPK
ncbi:MAG: succinylglutamate desuccinylase/aspartoacylase family protein [Candidatus Aminicenantes bacterium]|nr:succinylglutamate desuccinylase/aspartoacylase family protein [Candidatus Aminicenantes bacterium]